jgi:hypothetical protein
VTALWFIDWDTTRQVIETKGIGKQAKKIDLTNVHLVNLMHRPLSSCFFSFQSPSFRQDTSIHFSAEIGSAGLCYSDKLMHFKRSYSVAAWSHVKYIEEMNYLGPSGCCANQFIEGGECH